MDPTTAGFNQASTKADEEKVRHEKRVKLKALNSDPLEQESSRLDSSLKRHTALIKRMRQTIGAENRDQIIKELDSLTLEKYVDEMSGVVIEGIGRCKTEKDVWSAVEVISNVHRRFPTSFTPALVSGLSAAIAPPNKATLASLAPEQREKEDISRISRQRPVLRVCSELALVGIIKDSPTRSGGEWIMKAVKELLSNDPSLSSLPLLSTFLKFYSRSFLGISPPAKPSSDSEEVKNVQEPNGSFPKLTKEGEELIEQDIRDRFKRMCEGYFDTVCKKLVIEHKRLQDQDQRNHEAYIRSGEIFEDRQQQYEKMTKGYEKLLSSCQTLSELLYLPLPSLPTSAHKPDSILIGVNTGNTLGDGDDDAFYVSGGKWEDEEERRFFEDLQDLKDYVPKSVLGIVEEVHDPNEMEAKEKVERERVAEEIKKLEAELEGLKDLSQSNGAVAPALTDTDSARVLYSDEEDVPTPTPGTPKANSPPLSPLHAPQGPTQMLTALLARLSDTTSRNKIDEAAVDFALLNSKAARKRLIKFLGQVPKNRTDLLPHYSRLVATLNKYMPDIGQELVTMLDEEFRYLQRKKLVVRELAEVRMKNIAYLSNLTKFRVVPPHIILHMFKVCLDDFSGTNVDNIALLLEGCGRFLLRSEETKERFATMLELMKRKQGMQHFDQRQLLLLENAYYQCNPPERGPRQEKQRSTIDLFVRHLIYDVLSKRSIDKVLKLIRKLDWDDEESKRCLYKVFTKPWKLKYSSISLLAMLGYDLQRYRPAFVIGVVDQVLEDVRRGLEQNVYSTNQRRVATIKYLAELYIYRLLSSGIVFDTLWSLVTFGHPDGRPMPKQICTLDMPDDFFRIRLVCVLLDTCGMCFDRGTQKKKLDNFLTYFQYYVLCKEDLPMDVEFMLTDSLEAVRPTLKMPATIEEAAIAVDEMFNQVYQDAYLPGYEAEDREEGEDSENEDRRENEAEEEDDAGEPDSPTEERAPSPDQVVVLSASASADLGPTEQDDSEFAKELAKMLTDSAAESRKVDKKTALALFDSSVLPPAVRKKRIEDETEDGSDNEDKMKFTVITKRGNKQQARQLAVPADSALAVQTRSAQLQDKAEQQHLKRFVLDYEQREEAEELKALEVRNRAGAIKIRYVG